MSSPEASESADYKGSASDGAILLKSELDRLKEERREEKRRENRYRCLQLTFNIVLGVTSVFTLGAVGYQAYLLRQYVGDTHAIANASTTQAHAASQAAAIASQALKDTQTAYSETLRQMEAQTEAQQKTARVGKDTLAQSVNAWHADEQARVNAIPDMPLIPAVEPSKIAETHPVKVTVSIFNSGRTPARKAVSQDHVTFSPMPLDENGLIKNAIARSPASFAVLAPGVKYQTAIYIPASDIPKIKSRLGPNGGYTYVWGDVAYFDIFNERHITQYCSYRAGDSPDFVQCTLHNDIVK